MPGRKNVRPKRGGRHLPALVISAAFLLFPAFRGEEQAPGMYSRFGSKGSP